MKLSVSQLIQVILLLPALFLTTTASTASPSLQVIDFQLRWHHQFQFAGYYAAIEKGFYRSEGLDVRLHEGVPGRTPVEEVLIGHAQYAESNSELLYARMQGKPLVALAAIFQHSPSVLLTRKDSGINSPHDLIGKKVMLMNTTTDADFHAMLLHEGIKPETINIIPTSFDFEDLVSGKVDAFNSYLTNEPFILKQRGISYKVIDPSTYGIDFYSDILFTTEQELNKHPERVEAFRRATLKGWRYAMDHPDEIIDLLINKYNVQKSREHLKFEADAMRPLILPDLIEIGHMNPGRWRRMAELFTEAGMWNKDFSLEGFIYDTTPKQLPTWVKPVLITGFFLITVIFAVLLYLQRLNRYLAKAHLELHNTNIALAEEVEDRKSAEKSTHEGKERLRLALAVGNQGWFDLNIKTGEVAVSSGYVSMIGYDPSVFHSSLDEWKNSLHPDDRDAVKIAFQECLVSERPKTIEYRRHSAKGNWIWISSVGKVTEWDENNRPLRMIGTHTNISKRKRLEDELKRQAHKDYLTGLNNRGYFMQLAELELSRTVRYKNPLSILMIDIDFFKQINDRHGHKAGDTVLKKLAEVCRFTLREIDIIGRVGGEEFAILLPETDENKALEVAERLRANIADTKISLANGRMPLSCSVSIGLTVTSSKEYNLDALLSLADNALYEAKNSGRNRVCVIL